MAETLRKTYFALISPAVLLSAILFVLQQLGLWEGSSALPSRFFMISLFVVSIATGVAIPIFFRALIFGKVKKKGFLTVREFFDFQKKNLFIISITPYFAFLAGYFRFDNFYFGGITLAAIYAMYYHYPSEKKIAFDKKVFMVKNEN